MQVKFINTVHDVTLNPTLIRISDKHRIIFPGYCVHVNVSHKGVKGA